MKRKNEGRIETLPGRLPSTNKRSSSILVDETRTMAREQRLKEQEGHRKLAKVHTRDHPEEVNNQATPDGEFINNNIMQHPNLDNQRFDGTDSTLNPAPDLNTEARLKYDNERREQEKEKQERLENVLGIAKRPKFSPRPGGP